LHKYQTLTKVTEVDIPQKSLKLKRDKTTRQKIKDAAFSIQNNLLQVNSIPYFKG
jgi:transcriptional regulator of met regulon